MNKAPKAIAIILAVAAFFAGYGAARFFSNAYRNWDSGESISEHIKTDLENSVQRIAATYRLSDWQAYALANINAIKIINSTPLEILLAIDEPLVARLRGGDIEPFLTVIIEYAYRLGRWPTRQSRIRFEQLSYMYQSHASESLRRAPVLMRAALRGESYRLYSSSAGNAVASLMMSKFGQTQLATGMRPEGFLRVATLIWSCRTRDIDRSTDSSATLPCDLLLDGIAGALDGSSLPRNSADILGAIETQVGSGVLFGAKACLLSFLDDSSAAFSRDALEQRQSCAGAVWGQTPGSFFVSSLGNIVMAGDGIGLDLSGFLADYHQVGETENTFFSDYDFEDVGVSGLGSYQSWTTRYESNSDPEGTVSVTRWVTTGGDEGISSGTSVTVANSEGATTTHYDDSGSMTGVEWYGQGGNSGTSYVASMNDNGTIKKEVITDQDGTVTEVTYDDNGSSTTVTYDSEGRCTSNCANIPDSQSTSASTPAGDWEQSQCGDQVAADLRAASRPPMSPLDPLIRPNPEHDLGSIQGAAACLASLSSDDPLQSSCQSVALCIDPMMVDSDCMCGAKDAGSAPPPDSSGGICAQVTCVDGSCDPRTGTCRTGTPGEVDPGPLPLPIMSQVPGLLDLVPKGSPTTPAFPPLGGSLGEIKAGLERNRGVPEEPPP